MAIALTALLGCCAAAAKSAVRSAQSPLGYAIFSANLSESLFGIVFALAAGIMIFLSFDELLPAAHRQGMPHLPIYGLFAGMAAMAITLVFAH